MNCASVVEVAWMIVAMIWKTSSQRAIRVGTGARHMARLGSYRTYYSENTAQKYDLSSALVAQPSNYR